MFRSKLISAIAVTLFVSMTSTIDIDKAVAGETVFGTAEIISNEVFTSSRSVTTDYVGFKLDDSDLGFAHIAPHSIPWNSTLAAESSHVLSAIARTLSGIVTSSSPVVHVMASNKSSTSSVIRFDFTAEVTRVGQVNSYGGTSIGDTFSRSLTFDSSVLGSGGVYRFSSVPPVCISVTIGTQSFQVNEFEITVKNNVAGTDQLLISGQTGSGENETFFQIVLTDNQASVFSDQSLPLTPPNLSLFEMNTGIVRGQQPTTLNPLSEFRLTSLTIGQVPVMTDLIVDDLTLTPQTPSTAEEITFSVVVRNVGSIPAGPSNTAFKVGGETFPPLFSVPALLPGEGHTIKRTLVLGVAQYYITTVTADINQDVPESNETNNQIWKSFRVSAATGTDLIVESLTLAPENPSTADTITFSAIVRNIGTETAGLSVAAFKVGGETFPPLFPIPALQPSESHTIQRTLVLGVAQNYITTVTADVNQDVPEANEGNNRRWKSFRVNGDEAQMAPVPLAPVPWTGQSRCFDNNGHYMDCAGSGQDGENLPDVHWPSPRFSQQGEVITDLLTGLAWSRDANILATRGDDNLTWSEALDYIKSLNDESYAGYQDWRLPNANELLSLIDWHHEAIQGQHRDISNLFDLSQLSMPYGYWTSTTIPISKLAFTYSVHFSPTFWRLYAGARNNTHRYIWPVRGPDEQALFR